MELKVIRETPTPPPLKEVTITFSPQEVKHLRRAIYEEGHRLVCLDAARLCNWDLERRDFCTALYGKLKEAL